MAHPNAHPVIAVQGGGTTAAPTLLGQGPARIPTGGKIVPASRCSPRRPPESPRPRRSTIRAWPQASPSSRSSAPSPRRCPISRRRWCRATCRGSPCGRKDFPNPEIARGDSGRLRRGSGRRPAPVPLSGRIPLRLLADRDAARISGLGYARKALLVAILGRWTGAPLHVPCPGAGRRHGPAHDPPFRRAQDHDP